MAREITQQEFEDVVLKASNPVLVDFAAAWCPPCKQLAPILERWAEANKDKVDAVKVDVDAAAGLATEYDVMSVPTLVLFINGEERARATGLQNEKGLDALLAKASG